MFRAMLRGLLAHKLRLVLSATAVVLGTLFMSAAFVAGDTMTKGFERLFSTINESIDVQVTARDTAPGPARGGVPTALVDQAIADQVAGQPGVARSIPQVVAEGARVVGRDGKVVGSAGPPRFGVGWVEDGTTELREGGPPRAADDIAIDAGLAKTTGYRVGDVVDVITLVPRSPYRIKGIFGYAGGRDSLAGESTVAFTMATAQRVLLDAPGKYTNIDVTAAGGVSPATLRQTISATLGQDFVVRTGAETAKAQQQDVQGVLSALRTALVVFALVGLFTGAFLIFNTFSMLVAQRTRELALYRSFGAGRGQVNRAVLAESALLGLVSSLVGLGVGVGVGWLLVRALQSFSNADLPVSGVVVRPGVVIGTLLVGTGFTVAAALVPALRASRVPPIAAMRDAATPDKPLGRLTLAGAAVAAVGIALLALDLTGTGDWPPALTLGGGALLAFLGVAMLAPIISRPVTAVLGKVFGRSVPGRLGVRNTGRNPRRTAVTAAALMIGVALATGAGVFAASAKAGIARAFAQDLTAELVVSADFAAGPQAGFDPALVERMRAIPGVAAAVALRGDFVDLNGTVENGTVKAGAVKYVVAGDAADARSIFNLTATQGEIRPLASGEVLLDEDTAKSQGLAVGDTLTIRTARGGTRPERVVGVFATNQVLPNPLLSNADAAGFRSPYAQQGFVKVTSADQVAPVKARLDALFADNPEVTVADQSALVKQGNQLVDVLLTIINVLLGLTILIAVLGVINTLLLSIFERTRELGLVRAVGMSRGQVGRMVTVESVLISVFGALLGMVVGVALGLAVVEAVGGEFLRLAVPWGYLVAVLLLAVVAGVVAAILPAIRAARLNVLAAIAYE